MKMHNRNSIYRGFSILGVAAATLLVVNTAAFAQSGGGCQRGAGPNGGPPPGMGMPSGYNPQGSGNMPAYGPVARTSPRTRAAFLAQLKANKEANMAKLRERQAAIHAQNASRQKTKPTKSSSSTSPTA